MLTEAISFYEMLLHFRHYDLFCQILNFKIKKVLNVCVQCYI